MESEASERLLVVAPVRALGLGEDARLGRLPAHDGVTDGVLRRTGSTAGAVVLLA